MATRAAHAPPERRLHPRVQSEGAVFAYNSLDNVHWTLERAILVLKSACAIHDVLTG